ncbi:putative non-structural protein 32 [Etheostoma fonticola aquareovirus]|uniref:putative non-structural protein 32 n=1 Tax=Etheostoma fonticola aquareovirus TaxID=1862978 RepID=UPI0007F17842|nr:putative non-structural protein 32 [Etheostoma fonticola aquareovirus]ANN11953.1 putative non-structural protein 32 [Etheostoma fonticola aquareovirus]
MESFTLNPHGLRGPTSDLRTGFNKHISYDLETFPEIPTPSADHIPDVIPNIDRYDGNPLPLLYDGRLTPITGPHHLWDLDGHVQWQTWGDLRPFSPFSVWPASTPNWRSRKVVHVFSNMSPYAYTAERGFHRLPFHRLNEQTKDWGRFWDLIWRCAQTRGARLCSAKMSFIQSLLRLSPEQSARLPEARDPIDLLNIAGWDELALNAIPSDLARSLMQPPPHPAVTVLECLTDWFDAMIRVPYDVRHPLGLGLTPSQFWTHPFVVLCYLRWRLLGGDD